MEKQKLAVLCPGNEELATFMLSKWQELAARPKGMSDNLHMTLSKAYSNVCSSKAPIESLKELSQINGVGKWILKQTQDFFKSGSVSSEPEDLTRRGANRKGTKRYAPQKNSVAYALLICLYRSTANGTEFMRKQELIDAAEASGLSRVPIAPEKGKGKSASFGSSPREWYSGWSCMKTLINKGLVAKSSCPAKYMLTPEGQESARECLLRSGFQDTIRDLDDTEECSVLDGCRTSDLNTGHPDLDREVTMPYIDLSTKKSIDVQLESLERFIRMGYSKERVLRAFAEVSQNHQKKEISLLWPSVLCRLREDQVYGLHSDSRAIRGGICATLNENTSKFGSLEDFVGSENGLEDSSWTGGHISLLSSSDNGENPFSLRTCSSSDHSVFKSNRDSLEANMNGLSRLPLTSGERFQDAYEVILLLDDREQFSTQGSRSRRIIESTCSQFKIHIEVRRLPVGDGIWIARQKSLDCEYVLDFIVERKTVDDLRSSIRDHRYKDQKVRLMRCGLKKLIYLVEGDPNSSEAAESIKTACFTTEILEGFDVQRTNGLGDTLKKYGYLTQAISQWYRSQLFEDHSQHVGICPSFDEFVRRCQDLDKLRVSDVFAVQLMQVPQVTEDGAYAVLDLYPTLISLARAYSILDGDVGAQEEMLKRQSNNVISAVASRNILQFVWGNSC